MTAHASAPADRSLDPFQPFSEADVEPYRLHVRRLLMARLEAWWMARGGLECQTEDDLAALVRWTLRYRFMLDVTLEEAATLAASAIYGFAINHPESLAPPEPPECDGRCIPGYEVYAEAPAGSFYALDPDCTLHGSPTVVR